MLQIKLSLDQFEKITENTKVSQYLTESNSKENKKENVDQSIVDLQRNGLFIIDEQNIFTSLQQEKLQLAYKNTHWINSHKALKSIFEEDNFKEKISNPILRKFLKENYNQRNLEGYPRMLCQFSNKESQLVTANPRKLNIQTIENNDNELNILVESPLVIINYTGKVFLLGHIKLTIPTKAKEEKVSIDYSEVNIEFIINHPKNLLKLPVFLTL